MAVIFLPIKPIFAHRIMAGVKHYEYRKAVPAKDVSHIVIYASSPEKKIVGIARVEEIVSGTVKEVWDCTHRHSGVDKDFYLEYFNERQKAYAIKLTDVKKLRRAASPFEYLKDFSIPQSFRYIEKKLISQLHDSGVDSIAGAASPLSYA